MNIIGLNIEKHIPLVLGIDEHWKAYDKTEELLSLVNPINYEFVTNSKTTKVLARPISCYKDSLILKVQDITWSEEWAVFYFLYSNENYFQLGSINEEIVAINDSASLNLQRSTIFDYLKIVGYFYIVDHQGSCFAIESRDSEFIDFLPYSNQLEKNRNLEKVKPPLITGPDKEGAFEAECDFIIGASLTRGKFKIEKNGSLLWLSNTRVIG